MTTTFLPSRASTVANAAPAVPAPTITTSASYSDRSRRPAVDEEAEAAEAAAAPGAPAAVEADGAVEYWRLRGVRASSTSAWMKATPQNATRYRAAATAANAASPTVGCAMAVVMKVAALEAAGLQRQDARQATAATNTPTATTLEKANHSHAGDRLWPSLACGRHNGALTHAAAVHITPVACGLTSIRWRLAVMMQVTTASEATKPAMMMGGDAISQLRSRWHNGSGVAAVGVVTGGKPNAGTGTPCNR